MFLSGERVSVPSQGYDGDIVAVRENGDCLVRYVVPNARRSYYETWWPISFLTHATAS